MPRLTRDLQRAYTAYSRVRQVPQEPRYLQEAYSTAINSLGANVIRLGLAGTVAWLERLKSKNRPEAHRILEDLAEMDILGLEGESGVTLPAKVRALDSQTYMIASRDVLNAARWLKRATQAGFPPAADSASGEVGS